MTTTLERPAPTTPPEPPRSLRDIEGNAPRRRRKEKAVGVLLAVLMGVAIVPLLLILYQVVLMGWGVISWEFLTEREHPPAREGGGYAAGFVGTGIMVTWAALMAIPTGIAAAVYLTDYGKGWLARSIRFFTDVMTGIPSVFVGLAIYSLVILGTDFTFGAFPGALAIAVIMLPIVVRSSEEILLTVPDDLRQGALAMGARKWQTTLKVVLPTAAPGLTTGAMLAVARGAGETAPLILTAFGNINVVTDLYNVAIGALPLQIYNGARQPFTPGLERAWGGALCLLVMVLGLILVARYLSNRYSKMLPHN